MLRLVPGGRWGRWQCAAVLLATLLALFWLAGVFTVARTDNAPSWPAALFFCAIVAYITPIFHYITRRTEAALAELAPDLGFSENELNDCSAQISSKRPAWVFGNLSIGITAWLLQSWILAGALGAVFDGLTSGPTSLAMSLGPLPVWVFMSCAIHALVDNARLFRRLARRMRIDLLDNRALHPFGSMAVSSTLVVIGSVALFPIMWLDAETDPWTTIPGLLGTMGPMVFLFLAPVLPIHRAVRRAKQTELEHIQAEISGLCRTDGGAYGTLAPLLVYRREIAGAPEWPFDLSIVARLGLYLVIVPLTWIGAALIENLVDFFLG